MARALLALVCVVALVSAACGDDETTATDITAAPGGTTTSTASEGSGEPTGEPIDIFPYEGDELAVVGVAADDTLNVRIAPGTDAAVVTELDPVATGLVATGHNRSLGGAGIWAEVEVEGTTGWVHTSFVAQTGQVEDVTTQIASTPADLPSAPSMEHLAMTVAGAVTGGTEGPEPRITIVDGPHSGDLEDVTVDVLGIGDDSVAGYRLHVFATPDGGQFVLRTVEQTLLCSRGVTDDGLCL